MATTLPIELWTEILDQLDEKDIKEVYMVCKSWNAVANPYIRICISLDCGHFEELLEDLTNYPSFATKVAELKVESEDVVDNVYIFQDILNLCSSLLVLKFAGNWIRYSLQELCSEKTKLPNIQQIQVMDLLGSSGDMRKFNVLFNYQFRDTITSLDLVDKEYQYSLDKYGGLMNYISYFPHLTRIKISGDEYEQEKSVDLNRLLEIHKELEELEIEGIQFHGELLETPYPSLKRLRITKTRTDITMITYIMARFANLEEFLLVDVLLEYNSTLTDMEAQSIRSSLYEFCADNSVFWYSYGNLWYGNDGYFGTEWYRNRSRLWYA